MSFAPTLILLRERYLLSSREATESSPKMSTCAPDSVSRVNRLVRLEIRREKLYSTSFPWIRFRKTVALLEFIIKIPLGNSVMLLHFQDGIGNILYFLSAIIFIQINIK